MTLTAAAPVLVGAFLLDQMMAPAVRLRPEWSNTYRLLARRE